MKICIQDNNPPWTSCDAGDTTTPNGQQTKTAEERLALKSGRTNLVGMTYDVIGTINLDDLVNQLQKDKGKVLLRVDSNFVNKMNFGIMRSQRNSDGDNVPLKIANTNTLCKYQAPTLAVALGHPGVNTQTVAETFELSNPPFLKCDKTTDARYSVNFGLSESELNNLEDAHFDTNQKVKINIIQSIGGNNLVKNFPPKYSGELITNPGESNEHTYDFSIERGTNIFTECSVGLTQ